MTNTETATAALIAALTQHITAAELTVTEPGEAASVLDRATGQTISIGYDPSEDDDLMRFGWYVTGGGSSSRGLDMETAAQDLAQLVRLR